MAVNDWDEMIAGVNNRIDQTALSHLKTNRTQEENGQKSLISLFNNVSWRSNFILWYFRGCIYRKRMNECYQMFIANNLLYIRGHVKLQPDVGCLYNANR